MEHLPRSIERLAEERSRQWLHERRVVPSEPPQPVITVSRQHGADGDRVAGCLAEQLGLHLYDREILDRIAAEAHLNASTVSPLDERDRELLADWLAPLALDSYLSASGYRDYLIRVVRSIAGQGGAVILGRGAHLILGESQALRILVVAPLPARVAEVARAEGLSPQAARRRVAEVDGQRRAFMLRHFHKDPNDLAAFDLVVNSHVLGVAGAVAATRSAVERWMERPPAARAG
jgi:cytidylate kinase